MVNEELRRSIKELSNPRADIRWYATYPLIDAAKKGADVSGFIPQLVDAFEYCIADAKWYDENSNNTLAVRNMAYFFEKVCENGADISKAIPHFFTILREEKEEYNFKEGWKKLNFIIEETLTKALKNEKSRGVTLQALFDNLEDEHPIVRFHSAQTLANAAEIGLDISPAIDVLASHMEKGHANARVSAEALANAAKAGTDIGTVFPALVRSIDHKLFDIRVHAAIALGTDLPRVKRRFREAVKEIKDPKIRLEMKIRFAALYKRIFSLSRKEVQFDARISPIPKRRLGRFRTRRVRV